MKKIPTFANRNSIEPNGIEICKQKRKNKLKVIRYGNSENDGSKMDTSSKSPQ